jgi:peptidyl-prolyl cis-trans isomerase-like 1
MIQGGDPAVTGWGGMSIYGQRLYVHHKSFSQTWTYDMHSEAEIHSELRFTGAGILAMADLGLNTIDCLLSSTT